MIRSTLWKSIDVAAVVGVVALAAPAAARVAGQPGAVSVYTLSPGRIGATVAVLLGLVGAAIGGLALARSARQIGPRNGRGGAIVALVLGPIGPAIGGLVVATADGGIGTGNGLRGGIVAMTVGRSAWPSAGWPWPARAAQPDYGRSFRRWHCHARMSHSDAPSRLTLEGRTAS